VSNQSVPIVLAVGDADRQRLGDDCAALTLRHRGRPVAVLRAPEFYVHRKAKFFVVVVVVVVDVVVVRVVVRVVLLYRGKLDRCCRLLGCYCPILWTSVFFCFHN